MSTQKKTNHSAYQRSHQRRPALEVVAMIWDEENSPATECICRDVSTSGILLESKEELPIAKYLRVSLHNSQNREHVGSLNTRVIRCQKNKWGSYDVGLEIIKGANPEES